MDIAKSLNRYITDHGIKKTYLAQKTGLSADTISKMLNGKRRIFADEFLKICEALEIDPNDFRKARSA